MSRALCVMLAAAGAASALPVPGAQTTGMDPFVRLIVTVGVILVFVLLTWFILGRLVKMRNELAEDRARGHAARLVAQMLIAGAPLGYEVVEELIDSCRREYKVPLTRLTVADLLEDVQARVLMDELLSPRLKGEYLEELRRHLDEAQKRDARPAKKTETVKGKLKETLAEMKAALEAGDVEKAKAVFAGLKKAAFEVYRFGAAFNPLYDALTLARKHPRVALFGAIVYFGIFLFALLTVWSM
jgi:hypothetical protein